MAEISPELMGVLDALRMGGERSINAITQIVYELDHKGILGDEGVRRISAVLKGGPVNHPDHSDI